MSLQHTANHLAAQGRHGDSVLMHVSPNEVAGLQALAQRHGRSMTVNPDTGMPEAFELKDLLPAAGFALDYFLPGVGTAAAGMVGITGAGAGAIGTAGIIGGLTGLASGSFADGIKAGIGAYGLNSLASGLGAAGSNANTLAANNAAQAAGLDDAERVAAIQAAAKPDIGAGFKAAAANPIDFLKNNKFGVAAAALPSLMNMGSKGGAPGAAKNPGYIRQYTKNPVTGALEQVSATPVDEWGDRPAVSFGGVGQPVRYAAKGGSIGNHLVYNPTTKKYDTVDASGKPVGPVTFGGVRKSANMRDPNDTRTDSQKAYDYLMGTPGAKNPMLFYHQQPGAATGALVPADLNTRTGGHYVINAAGTGYDWVPDASAGIASLVGEGGAGGQDRSSGVRTDDSYDSNSLTGGLLSTLMGKQDPAPVIDINTMSPYGFNPYAGDPDMGYSPGTPNSASRDSDTAEKDNVDNTLGSGIQASDRVDNAPSTGIAGLTAAETLAAEQALANAQNAPSVTNAPPDFGPYPDSSIDPGAYEAGFTGTRAFNGNAVNMGGGPGVVGSSGAPYFDANAAFVGASRAAYNAAPAAEPSPAPISSVAPTASESFAYAPDATRPDAASRDAAAYAADVVNAIAPDVTAPDVGGDAPGGGDVGNTGGGVGGGGLGGAGGGGDPALNANGGVVGRFAQGGLGSLGGYSDGGRLLRGPGDGVSDSIPATIGRGRQPARLADGEFVIPARIVSELGNGSTAAGAKQLYAMMARIQAGRKKSIGKNNVAKNSRAARHLPA